MVETAAPPFPPLPSPSAPFLPLPLYQPYRVVLQGLGQQLVPKVSSECVGHVLHEMGLVSAVVLNGEDQGVVTGNKGKL